MEGISWDVWDTILSHVAGAEAIAEARTALLSARTGVDHAAALAALAFRLPQESAGTLGGSIGVSVLERTRLALRMLGDPPCDSNELARELSEVAASVNVVAARGISGALARLVPLPQVIVSNTRWTSGATLRRLVDATITLGLFSTSAFSDEVGWAKPNPRLFEVAWRDLGVSPRATVHIGDRVNRDLAGARACGAKSILCRILRRNREKGDCCGDGLLYDYDGLDAILQLLADRETPHGWQVVAEGVAVWGPPVVGRVQRVDRPDASVDTGRVILLKDCDSKFIPLCRNAAAVITEASGSCNYVAQSASLYDTPCVTGIGKAFAESIVDNALLLIDSRRGRVLRPNDNM